MAAVGQRFAAVIEVLIQDMVREKDAKSRAPSSVSILSLRDAKGRRRQEIDQLAMTLDIPRSIATAFGRCSGDRNAGGSDISAVTAVVSKGSQERPFITREGSNKELSREGRGAFAIMGEAAGDVKERCKTT